jgi:COMPASS component SPP1
MNGTSHPSESPQQSTCMKKRCSRHYEWAKLHIEDNKFEIGLNSNNLQALEKEEGNIIQRARLRAREIRAGGVGGTVEFHGEYLPEKENKEDRELGVAPVVEGTRDVEMKEEGDEQSQKSEEEEAEQKKEGPEELEQKSEDVVAVEEIQEVQEVQEVQEDDGEDKEVDMVDAIAASI